METGSAKRAATASVSPGISLGDYVLHAPIAAGGMATVHLARASVTGRIVAVKRLRSELADDPAFVTMFLDEARLAAQIEHENVVRTLDVVADGPESYIVMEYVEGETLSRLLRTYAPPPFDVIARVIIDVLRGLHAAHTASGSDGSPLGVVHRDISPQNVLVDVSGVARLIDFGVAMAHGRMQHTRDGEIKGKLGYMPPEQLEGKPATIRSDIYATGVVFWELLTGRRLFRADNEGAVVVRILRGEIVPPTEMWQKHARHTLSFFAKHQLELLDALTMRALALDPEKRFESAAAMADELERALPPAPRSEVAAWVCSAARDLLASRATLLAEIEAASGISRRTTQEVISPDGRPSSPPSAAPQGRLPVLFAELPTKEARDELVAAARDGAVVRLQLDDAPIDGAEHILEIHVAGVREPAFVFALPIAAANEDGVGFRLRLDESATTYEERATVSFGDVPSSIEADVLGRTIARGELTIEERIGAGGGGVVYRARHRERSSHVVAVKVLHDGARRDLRFCERFHAEALAASRLDHANVVRVLDFGQEADGLLYFTMPLLAGESLRQTMKRERRLAAKRAIEIMLQVCAGLAHAHERGVIHRDVKPGNIMLVPSRDDDGRPIEVAKVCDFGVALQHGADLDRADAAARVAGTLEYMSPEQCRGEAIDARSDVYACGVVLYELLTGRPPFLGASRSEIISQHLAASPAPPSRFIADGDPRLDTIVLAALAKDRANRPQSMSDLRRQLKTMLPAPSVGRGRKPIGDETPMPRTIPIGSAEHLALQIANAPERMPELLAMSGDLCGIDQAILEMVADRVLASEHGHEDALALLRWARGAGAIALCRARARSQTEATHERFVAAMQALGANAAPAVRGALQVLLVEDPTIADEALAIDLLSCVPRVANDDLGVVVARCASVGSMEVARVALDLLIDVWGDRSRPLLRASLYAKDEALAAVAIRGLKRMQALDPHVAGVLANNFDEPARSRLIALLTSRVS